VDHSGESCSEQAAGGFHTVVSCYIYIVSLFELIYKLEASLFGLAARRGLKNKGRDRFLLGC